MNKKIEAWCYENSNPRSDGVIIFNDEINLADFINDCMADIGPKWVSANEKWPEEEAGILMITNSGKIYSGHGCVFNRGTKQRVAGGGFVSDYYTHWMPLPKAPE